MGLHKTSENVFLLFSCILFMTMIKLMCWKITLKLSTPRVRHKIHKDRTAVIESKKDPLIQRKYK